MLTDSMLTDNPHTPDVHHAHPMPPKYDYHILAAALEGLETQRARLDEQIQRVRDMLASMEPSADCSPTLILPPRKPRLTPEGRQAISEAQRRRWDAEREAKARKRR